MVATLLFLGGGYAASNNNSISNAMFSNAEKAVVTQLVENEADIAICYGESSEYEMYHKAIGTAINFLLCLIRNLYPLNYHNKI